MRYKKPGIRADLVELWRFNTKMILTALDCRREDLAVKIGVTRRQVWRLLNQAEPRLTNMQFLSTTQALKEMIEESEQRDKAKEIAWVYWNEIMDNYREKGLH